MDRALFCSLVLAFLGFSFSAEAREILVGGKSDAWKVPSSESDSLNKWAEKSRFRIGDSLAWSYDGSKDSVLQVNEGDYVKCNTTSPIGKYEDGNTKVKLHRSGAFFFISGVKGHCEKGQKLHVVVLSPRPVLLAPAPAPADSTSTAVPPATGASSRLSNCGFVAYLAAAIGIWVIGF